MTHEIGSFKILEEIGSGGMGTVYRAVDTELERIVAIKILNSDLAQQPDLASRFRAEARAQAGLNHTNVATLYSLVIESNQAWMVMEFVDGETFEQMLMRRGMVRADEIIPLFKQALLGIGHAHRQGIVHRDLKPSNIMLNRSGVVKVMDFGIAKALGNHGMTRTGTRLGTACYMSPEQVLNHNVDVRSDVYSLGITLYEMLTGRVPFRSDSEYQIMTDHVGTPPPRPTQYCSDIPKGIENAMLKALEKDPSARFPTVGDFGAALESSEILADAPDGFSAMPDRASGLVVDVVPDIVTPENTGPTTPWPGSKHVLGLTMGACLVVLLAAAWAFDHKNEATRSESRALLPVIATSQTDWNINPESPSIQIASPSDSIDRSNHAGRDPRRKTAPQPTDMVPASAQADPSIVPQSHSAFESTVTEFVLPAGTPVMIRTNDAIDFHISRSGQKIAATLASPLLVNGRLLAAAGSNATLRVTNLEETGCIEGRSSITLQLVELTVAGQTYMVHSNAIEKQGSCRGVNKAGKTAAASAGGGLVGRLFRRGKSVVVGAVAGAGAEIDSKVLRRATLPSKTLLKFRLQIPMELTRESAEIASR